MMLCLWNYCCYWNMCCRHVNNCLPYSYYSRLSPFPPKPSLQPRALSNRKWIMPERVFILSPFLFEYLHHFPHGHRRHFHPHCHSPMPIYLSFRKHHPRKRLGALHKEETMSRKPSDWNSSLKKITFCNTFSFVLPRLKKRDENKGAEKIITMEGWSKIVYVDAATIIHLLEEILRYWVSLFEYFVLYNVPKKYFVFPLCLWGFNACFIISLCETSRFFRWWGIHCGFNSFNNKYKGTHKFGLLKFLYKCLNELFAHDHVVNMLLTIETYFHGY